MLRLLIPDDSFVGRLGRSGCRTVTSSGICTATGGALHGGWKLVGEIGNHHGRFDRAASDAEKAKFELYNLRDDIGEKNDLAGQQPDIYRDLKQRHLEWIRALAK